MRKEDDKLLADLFNKYQSVEDTDLLADSKRMLELLFASITYTSGIRPNLQLQSPLSIKETLCLILLAVGKTPDQCADLLGLSAKSVGTYEKRIRHKLGARNRLNAFYLAQLHGYLSVEHRDHIFNLVNVMNTK